MGSFLVKSSQFFQRCFQILITDNLQTFATKLSANASNVRADIPINPDRTAAMTDTQRFCSAPKSVDETDAAESLVRRTSGSQQMPRLPPEVLAIIFSYLDVESKGRSAQVCKSWRLASYQPLVWRDVNVHIDLEPSTKPTWFRILPKYRGLSRNSDLTDLPNSHAFLQEMSHLTKITLSSCGLITEDGTITLVGCFRNTVSLTLSNCRGLTDDSLELIANGLATRLKYLNLRNCKDITDLGIGHLTGSSVKTNAEANVYGTDIPALESLELSGCNELTDKSLLYLSTGQRSLVSLNLDMCRKITNHGLVHVANMKRLRELSLSSCLGVTDESMAILSKMETLRELHLTGTRITDLGIISLARKGSPLTRLTLNGCLALTDSSCKVLSKMEQLRVVSICGCINIGETGLAFLSASKIRVINQIVKRGQNMWWQ